MKIALVAGGAGFIGSHLCRSLIERGYVVYCYDSLVTGRVENLRPIASHEHFHFIEGDVDSIDTAPAVHFDEVYNLACPASPPHYQRDRVKTLRTSFIGTRNMLDVARACSAKFMQFSTSEVYGNPLTHPQTESYWGNVNPVGPRSCYDEGKRAAETLVTEYRNQYGLDTKIIRIFNTYGPNMSPDDGRVVSNFICQALKGEDITIYGDGTQTRSFQYISDLIRGVRAVMGSPSSFSGPVNLGNPEEFTVLELARKVIDITGSSSHIVFHPLPVDDPCRRRPDITLARRELRWEPLVLLDDGLESTVEYFKRMMNYEECR